MTFNQHLVDKKIYMFKANQSLEEDKNIFV